MKGNLICEIIIVLLVCNSFGGSRLDSLQSCAEQSGLQHTSGFRMSQVIRREGQHPRKFKAECHLANKGEKLLVIFEDPPDMAGVKLLFKDFGKHLWTYFPQTNRVRKIVGTQSDQPIGSLGFSYNDLFPFLNDSLYTAKTIGSEKVNGSPCDILQLTHDVNVDTDYKKAHVLVDPEQCRIALSKFFGKDGRLLKTIHFESYEKVEGRAIPAKIRVTQPQKGEESEIKVLAIEFDKQYGSTYFSEISLKR